MKRLTILILCAVLLGCATMPTMPVRVPADSLNWHADSLSWVAEVKRQQTDNNTRQLIATILILATLGCYKAIGIPGAF